MAAALAVTPTEVASLTEEQACALFALFRFPKTRGEPYCEGCGSLGVWKYTSRKQYKCKGCGRRFSLTSGTAFAYRKIDFKPIMIMLARVGSSKRGVSACSLKEELRLYFRNYKTAWTWLHKARDALLAAQDAIELSDEVEVDGKLVGGFIRPKNTKKTGSDHRKFPYRHPEREQAVTFSRQRHGQVRSYIGRREEHCVPQLIKSLRKGTHVFTDQGHWGKIADAGFTLHQVSHKQQYQSSESSTNWCESQNKTLADLERTHSHISGNYLHLYAAQAAWRGDNTLRTPEQRFSSLMNAMLGQKRSGMAGYYLPKKDGGKQIRCKIVDAEGQWSTWSPPKSMKRFPPDPARVPTLKQAKSKELWNAGFRLVSAEDIIATPTCIPPEAGVYAIFVKHGTRLLDESGFGGDPKRATWTINKDYRHVYTGESYSLRQRLAAHTSGSVFVSNLRETLLALHEATGVLGSSVSVDQTQGEIEASLTAWIGGNVMIGFKPCHYVKDAEAAVLQRGDSPLNIDRQQPTPFAALLRRLRARWTEKTGSTWQRPQTGFTGRRKPRR